MAAFARPSVPDGNDRWLFSNVAERSGRVPPTLPLSGKPGLHGSMTVDGSDRIAVARPCARRAAIRLRFLKGGATALPECLRVAGAESPIGAAARSLLSKRPIMKAAASLNALFAASLLSVGFGLLGACSSVDKPVDGGAGGAHRGGSGGGAGGGGRDGGGGLADSGVDGQGDGGNAACASAAANGVCTGEGAVCGGCTDACNFCNILRCTGGHWTALEVAPAPCFACGATVRCQVNADYCVTTMGGAVGTPPSYHCSAVPAACRPTPTCACLAPAPALCQQTDAGAHTVTLLVP
jgi:hypothetical protein